MYREISRFEIILAHLLGAHCNRRVQAESSKLSMNRRVNDKNLGESTARVSLRVPLQRNTDRGW